MTWRTPPSLKWLIVKRSRISGLIEKLTHEQTTLAARLEHLGGLLPRLHRQLQSLDDTFGLHEIQIEPAEIAPVAPQQKAKILPLGQMSRILLKVMRLQGTWVTTSVLIHAVRAAVPDNGPEFDERYVNRAIRRRLGNLMRDGRVERLLDNAGHHDGSSEALWRIVPDELLPKRRRPGRPRRDHPA